MATEPKLLDLLPSKAPNLLVAPTEYSQQYQDQMNNALRLYFNQVDNVVQAAAQNITTTSGINSFPSGGIIMWSGSIASIPSGWALCNGSNGTPDLRNQFIIGAYQDSAGVPQTTVTGSNTPSGGTKDAVIVSHNHTASSTATDSGHGHSASDSGHTHGYSTVTTGSDIASPGGFGLGTFNTGTGYANISIGTGYANISVSTTNTATGVSGTNANLPPYLALAYIMKL